MAGDDRHERRIGELVALTEGPTLQARYAMKANSSWKVLEAVRNAGLWIDAVSGNEVLRARRPVRSVLDGQTRL